MAGLDQAQPPPDKQPNPPGQFDPFSPLPRSVVLLLIGLFYILGAQLSQTRAFDPDEFLHTHLAWSISKGLLPYRDYFDHYTPLYHVFLAPFFHFFRVETDVSDSLAFLFFARKLSWLISGLVLLLTFWLGKVWRNTQVGLTAVLFLLCAAAYWSLTLEIRPDTLATAFWLLFLITVIRAVQGGQHGQNTWMLFLLSGVFLSVGFITSQKNVYGFPGLAVGMCCYLWKPSSHGTVKNRLANVTYQFIGFCVPLLVTATYFYLQNGLASFIRYNFLFYLGVEGNSPFGVLHEQLHQHPFLGLLGGAGLLRSLFTLFRSKSLPWRGDFILAPAALSLIAGIFVIPTPYFQYYVLFLPLVALFAAATLLDFAAEIAKLRCRLPTRQWIALAALIASSLLGLIAWISHGAGSNWPPVIIVGYWFGVLFCSMALFFGRFPSKALVFFFIAMTVGPAIWLRSALKSPGATPQLEEIAYIIRNTLPTEAILDGYQGSGLYRPHAYFYWFLPYTDRSGISANEKEELLRDLNSGSIAPRWILFDINLREFSSPVRDFLEKNYEPVGVGVIWKRKRLAQASSAALPDANLR